MHEAAKDISSNLELEARIEYHYRYGDGAYKDRRFITFTSLDDEKYKAFLSVPILSKTK